MAFRNRTLIRRVFIHRSSFIVRRSLFVKVLHLVPSVGPSSGGLGTGPLATARAQRDAGVDVSLWCTDPADVVSRVAQGVDVVAFPAAGHRRFAFSGAAEHRARTAPADIVHQHGLWTAQGRVTAVFRSRGIVTVVAPHGSLAPYALSRSPWKKRAALAWFESRNLHQASCLHATSEAEVTHVQEVWVTRARGRHPECGLTRVAEHAWRSFGVLSASRYR